jgi:asparagine synthase (glutamine-hydrolysing)
MCGLAVIARSTVPPAGGGDERALRGALPRLRQRGPDGEGLAHAAGGRAALLHTRLAIQDVSPAGAQPMTLDLPGGGRLSLVYNGEIYNTAEMREALGPLTGLRSRSDTEVLLHAIARWGFAGAIERARGMFALVCVREQAGLEGGYAVDAAVDHAGMKPLAWAMTGGGDDSALLLASDTAALRAMAPGAFGVDRLSLVRVLVYGYCPPPRTVWAGVNKLAPGTRLHWRPGLAAPVVEAWWRPPASIAAEPGVDQAATLEGLLERVAVEHLAGDVPIAMFLSAGIDSASVALALRRAGADMGRITALTLSTGDATDGGDEATDAAELARRLGMPHGVVRFAASDLDGAIDLAGRAFDEPQGYTALLTAARIVEATRRAAPDARVVLTGDGGDEALGGYAWHSDAPHAFALDAALRPDGAEHERLAALVAGPDARGSERIAANLEWSRRSLPHRYARRLFDGFHPAEACALVGAPATDLDEDLAAWLGPAVADALPWPRRAQRLDVLGFCAGSITPKLDRAAMARGLELRCPLLDRRVLDWSLGLAPIAGERTPGGSKPLLRAFLRRGVDDGLVPGAILERPKRGFSLRLSDDSALEALAGRIDGSSLVASGLLRPDWARFIPGDPVTRRARLALLAQVAAWYGAWGAD